MDTQTQTTEEAVTSTSSNGGKGNRSLLVGIIIIILVLAAGAFVYLKPFNSTKGTSAVAATVDGVEITQQDIDNRITRNKDALEAQGKDLNDSAVLVQLKDQIINQIINETLAIEAAKKSGLSVESSEIDAQYKTIFDRFDSEEAFRAELEKNRFTDESLRKNIERELLTQKYIEQITTNQNVEVTEEEISSLYDQLVAKSDKGVEIPKLEDVSSQLKDQIRNQKLSQIVSDAIAKLKDGAVIVITEKK